MLDRALEFVAMRVSWEQFKAARTFLEQADPKLTRGSAKKALRDMGLSEEIALRMTAAEFPLRRPQSDPILDECVDIKVLDIFKRHFPSTEHASRLSLHGAPDERLLTYANAFNVAAVVTRDFRLVRQISAGNVDPQDIPRIVLIRQKDGHRMFPLVANRMHEIINFVKNPRDKSGLDILTLSQ